MKDPHSVIKTIRLTEKATRLGEENNEYVFIVDPKSTKIEIKQAVEKHFGKKVVAVRTANFAGNHYKKAIVRLKDGERIELV